MRSIPLAIAILGIIVAEDRSHAEPGVCHALDVKLQPEKRRDLRPANNQPPQIVVWVEDAAGTFIDTVFITQETGTYGLGNRPGRMDFNSAPGWPYGRRTTVFPVWAERQPRRYDTIVFQDRNESNLSHRVDESSRETHYCRPMDPDGVKDAPIYDALSCASPGAVNTDKGKRDASQQSKYPPRQDVMFEPGIDDDSVVSFAQLNALDAISQATPATGRVASLGFTMPPDLGLGAYTLFVEVATEYDHNATYSVEARPEPREIPYSESGEPYRGQPSVVFAVPFTVDGDDGLFQTTAFAGFGDPDGATGTLHPPDATITTDLAGSGAQRLGLVTDAEGSYRVRVATRRELDAVVPSPPQQLTAAVLNSRAAHVDFIAPGDDGMTGKVRGYEVRYRVVTDASGPVTLANFDAADSIVLPSSLAVDPAGTLQSLPLTGLLPETAYSVGIRAYDDCGNRSALAQVQFLTPARAVGEVDACFIATAAYGSLLATDVQALRQVRDTLLRKTVLGELAVEAYYTFGPAVAGVIGESEMLRSTARELLGPIVRYVRAWRF